MAVSVGRLEVVTSDHVVLRYDLAGAGNRGFAALLDFVVAALLTVGWITAWSILIEATGGVLLGVVAFTAALFGWTYFILLEWLWNGQTLGKRVFGLRVINEDGSPARFIAVFVRNLVRVVDFLPGFYGFGLLCIVISSRSQRLGDLAAGTFVVRAPRPRVDWLALRTLDGGTRPPGEAGRARTTGAPAAEPVRTLDRGTRQPGEAGRARTTGAPAAEPVRTLDGGTRQPGEAGRARTTGAPAAEPVRTLEGDTGAAGEAQPVATEGIGGLGPARTTGAADPGLHVGALSGEAQRLVREFVLREAKLPRAERLRLAAQIAAHLRQRLPDSTEADDVELIRAVARALRASGER